MLCSLLPTTLAWIPPCLATPVPCTLPWPQPDRAVKWQAKEETLIKHAILPEAGRRAIAPPPAACQSTCTAMGSSVLRVDCQVEYTLHGTSSRLVTRHQISCMSPAVSHWTHWYGAHLTRIFPAIHGIQALPECLTLTADRSVYARCKEASLQISSTLVSWAEATTVSLTFLPAAKREVSRAAQPCQRCSG